MGRIVSEAIWSPGSMLDSASATVRKGTMGFLKRLAYDIGLVLGLCMVAAAGAVALTYLFTGKVVSIRSDKLGTRVVLESPDALAALIRQQVGKARGVAPAMELTLGDDDGEE